MNLTPDERELLTEIKDGVAYWLSIKDKQWVTETIMKVLEGVKK
jgi:hypothetical protein